MRKIVLVMAAGAIGLAAVLRAASAQQGWSTYVHPQFGTSIVYPATLFGGPAPSADGAVFSGAGATLQVSAIYRPDIATPGQLRAFMQSSPDYQYVTYSPEGRNWLVVSGYRGADIFYEKFFLAGGTVQGFSIQYPADQRATYDPVVEAIEDSFRSGPR
jgi:hypothetical protein